jgi:hypothetical protein
MIGIAVLLLLTERERMLIIACWTKQTSVSD